MSHDARPAGDDSFGGSVGDALPGSGGKPSREQTAAAYGVPAPSAAAQAAHPDTLLAAERLEDLQRVQAEYVNYKKRVDRDREVQRELVLAGMIESLLPVLDEIHLAREHGELQGGPFAKIAEKLEAILAKYGVERFGSAGETFDPAIHQALMHTQTELGPGVTDTTVTHVMQPGYRMGDRVIRPAMVAVADPA
ncbi:MAG: nucleotide exchange factor GrpE [Austwickia sp.]|nr:nucleotide exchange factor GrpE [Austwickia sp.]MBK9102233.1 nucleotide exchange factor GrpE [Austwickia sp.]